MSAPDDDRSASVPPTAPRDGRDVRSDNPGIATPLEADAAASEPPLKQHGDALLDGSGSRQGTPPEPALDAVPHE